MPNRLFSRTTTVLALLLALAAPASGQGPVPSVDDDLLRMGREIAGFGGLFYDAQGVPNVYLLDPEGAGAAVLKALGPEARLRRGEYEFERLLAWRGELRPLLALPGVVLLDVDETRNRVVLGLDATSRSKGRDRDRLEQRLAATAVPREAILLEEAGPVAALIGLRDKLRPVPGGAQIVFASSACTLGFNAIRGRDFGFVVNSHCTGVRSEVDFIRYSQSLPAAGAIGKEIADPAFFTDPPCPPGRRCRFSDSAFAKYDKRRTGALGKLARTTSGQTESGSLTLKPAAARFTISGRADSLLAGEVVHKMGRTTGWTFGAVVGTCVDTNLGPEITMLCQSLVRAGAGPGDSGSPVFSWNGGADVRLAGILWGGGFRPEFGLVYIFSPLAAIEGELGPLKID
jgi:hypothetical protein